jgi:hypothetical protein
VLNDNRVVAIGDEADWYEGRIVLDGAGRLVGFTDARWALMRDERGRPFQNKSQGDSEGLAQLADGRFAVSFERTNLIRIYDFNRDGPFGAAEMGPQLADVARLPANASFEALAAGAGVLVTGVEGGGDPTTPMWVVPLDATTPTPPRFAYPLGEGFSLTGMDALPDGGFVALERFYAPAIGPRARITRIAPDAFDNGSGVLAVEELALLAAPLRLDNFEGVSAVRMPDGGTRIYIISDNNGSRRQRTLLYAFDVVSPER